MALAVTAAGVLASNAQTVYSANIVGYANVSLLGNGKYNAVANTFNVGVSNGINEAFPSLPNGSVVYLFNGSSYVSYGYDNSIQDHANDWFTGGFDADITQLPIVAPGTGTFVVLPGALGATNTFVGTIVTSVGTTNTTATYAAGNYSFTGSPIPYAGQADGTNVNLKMPNGSVLVQWDPVNNNFVTSGYDTSIQDHSNDWFTGGFDADLANPPQIKVGESFFIVPTASYQWKQSL